MASNSYTFVTTWRVRGTLDEVNAILGEAVRLREWWPAVYLDVTEVLDETGRKRICLWTKGWLPYTLRWDFVVTERRDPHGFSLRAVGDFVGEGTWTFREDGEDVVIVYDWRIAAEKPLLRLLSGLMKPLFSANHRWAMAKGEESLKLELLRHRAGSPAERGRIPAPPPPTWPHRAWRPALPG